MTDTRYRMYARARSRIGVSLGDRQFDRAMGVLLGPAIVEGNRFDVLLNVDEIFLAMLAAIRRAEASITFESDIYWSGAIGQEVAAALSERNQAGVGTRPSRLELRGPSDRIILAGRCTIQSD